MRAWPVTITLASPASPVQTHQAMPSGVHSRSCRGSPVPVAGPTRHGRRSYHPTSRSRHPWFAAEPSYTQSV